MAIKQKNQKASLLESGSYTARITRIIDLGIQPKEYAGEKKPSEQQLYISFEFPTETLNINGEQKPRWLSQRYGFSLHEKSNLTKLLDVVDPNRKKFNTEGVECLLNAPVMVQVGLSSTGKSNRVVSVSPVPKGLEVGELYGVPSSFSIDDPDPEMWQSFPEWLQDLIRGAEDFLTSPLNDLDESLSNND